MTEKEAPNGYGLVKHGMGTLWLVHEDRGYTTWDWGDDPAIRFDTWQEAAITRKRIQKREPPADEQILVVPLPKRPRRHVVSKVTSDLNNRLGNENRDNWPGDE